MSQQYSQPHHDHGYPMYAGGSGAANASSKYGSGGLADSYDDLHEHGAFVDPHQQQQQQRHGLLSGAAAGGGGGSVSWAAHTPATAARERWMQRQDEGAAWNEKAAAKPSRKRWWWIGGGLLLLVIAAVGVGVGVQRARANANQDHAKGVVSGDKNDPSKFTLDPRLHRSLYGLCYVPTNTQYPACGASQDSIIEDIQLMSQLTPRLRLYGADCDAGNLVLTAIERTKVDVSVYLGLWVDDDADTWARQVQATKDVIAKHGVDHIAGIGVGNEYILNGGSVTTLLSRVNEVKQWVTAQNFNKHIPVGTADAGSMISTEMVEGVDFVFSNTHPWFGGVPIEDAGGWTWDYTNTNTPGLALAGATNKPDLYIAEVGWPTGANTTAGMQYQAATAGVPELQQFLDEYICQANANITAAAATTPATSSNAYFYFEYMDQEWKDKMYGGVEGHWGLFDENKQLKDIKIPDCLAP